MSKIDYPITLNIIFIKYKYSQIVNIKGIYIFINY